jgi:hypothetical protein
MPDMNRRNNYIKTRGLFKKAKSLELSLLTKLPNPKKNQIHVLPIGGYNLYNGWMGGFTLHNYGIFDKKLDIQASPMFAFKSKTITGFAELNVNLFPESVFRKISLGAHGKSFANAKYQMKNLNGTDDDIYLHYYRISPHIIFDLQNKDRTSHVKQQIKISHHFIFEDQLRFSVSTIDPSVNYFYKKNQLRQISAVDYFLSNTRAIHPYSHRFTLHHDGNMAKLFTELKQSISVSKLKNLELRLFAGVFLLGNDQQKGMYRFRMSGFNGYQDYLYESNFVGRNELDGVAFSQFSENDGAFKIWTPLGQSTDYLITLNIKSPRIWKLPLKVFIDLGTAGKRSLNKETLLWAGGLNFTLIQNYVDVYLPLLYSNDIKETLTLNNKKFSNSIRFTFNIHQLKPKEIIINNFQ